MSDQQHPAYSPEDAAPPSASSSKVNPVNQTRSTRPTGERHTPALPPDQGPSANNPLDAISQQSASVMKAITLLGSGLSGVMNDTAMKTSASMLETATGIGESFSHTASEAGKVIVKTTFDLGEIFTSSTAQTGKATVDTAATIGSVIGDTATQTGGAIAAIATSMGDAAARQIYQWLEQTTQTAGQAVDRVSNNPIVRRVSGPLKLDWLVGMSDRVDLERAEAAVRKLQQQHPDESPSEIAHRIMVQKATYAGGMGFASSILPGFATALLAIDLATTTAIQTEMVYQIAAAYGMDLHDPARKGEVLGIFGLALGGRTAVKAGLAFLRNVPLAGAMIGASTNATMVYSVGYAACRFYEAKRSGTADEPSGETLTELQAENERYLEVAISQQAIMDQILVHMVLASHPEKTWDDILPELKSLQLSETSLKAIANDIKSPKPLISLLDQLNRDFAVPLLAQCYRIALADGEITPREDEILTAIAEKFDLDREAVRAGMTSSDPTDV